MKVKIVKPELHDAAKDILQGRCEVVEMLDFLMGYESYLRKRQISVSSWRYKPTGKHRHSLG
jgi:hypothetical protein